MKKLRLLLEYHSSPIWVIDEDGSLLDNGLPNELKKHQDLDSLLEEIAEEYDSLYENSDAYFGYHGFQGESDKRIFFDKISQAINLIRMYAGNSYIIQVDINERDF
ncbi:hypothetical protein SDC9_69351 [bioreactor metagenome]|uniref:Uncharacterized protein n=1 Tax=bioreactor metagenome TaxID=1076179 RepID=A0A644Y4N4_9ZZZZ